MNVLNLTKKKVLVLGLGLHGGGIGVVKYLHKQGAKITVTDLRSADTLAPSLKVLKKYKGIRFVLGKHRERDIREAELIVKNPGVPPASPFLKLAGHLKIPITTDIGIFFQLCPATIIGITGTRGKSTTAHLVWKFLQEKRDPKYGKVFLGGNIRKSVLEILPEITKNDIVVLELSSFQLHDLRHEKKSPHVAIMTNIYRDHVNWHGSFDAYIKAKALIFAYQHPDDILFANPHDRVLRVICRKAKSKKFFPRLPSFMEKKVDEKLGIHYRSSVALAVAAARHFGSNLSSIKKVLRSYQGLEGRQETVAYIKGRRFVNDTTATMPEASIAALTRFGSRSSKKIILIAGGQDKQLDFKDFARAIKTYVRALVLLPGTATEKIREHLRIGGQEKLTNKDLHPILEAKNMKEAVLFANGMAETGDVVLLSPGAASFGLFTNEFDRGKKFVDEVRKLKL